MLEKDTVQSSELSEALDKNKTTIPENSRVVFVSGNFNIIHPGHLRLLYFAAAQGDFLVVGVFDDNIAPDVTNFVDERVANIGAINCVGKTVVLSRPPESYISDVQPDVVVKGLEFEKLDNREQGVVDSYGGKLVFNSGESRFTSFDIIDREINSRQNSDLEKPFDYLRKHGFDNNRLIQILENFASLNVVVIGDTIVDEYVNCDAIGMSQEDPTIVVRPNHSDYFLGGAGIVAAHAQSLGGSVNFHTVLGEDEFSKYTKTACEKFGFHLSSVTDGARPTTHKKRYRAQGKTLLRVNNFVQSPISEDLINISIEKICENVKKADLVVLSDFNYGMLQQKLIEEVIKFAKANEILVVADSQSSSQVGDISRFLGATLITPTEREARLALQNFDDGLVSLAEKLRRKVGAQHVFVTLGSEGVLIHTAKKSLGASASWQTDRLPAMNLSSKDPAGGGDAMLIVSSLALASGASVWEAAYLGSIGAACQVGRVGNIPLTADELRTAINE
jgi:rfaE bifunctional protein kinase chain/domain